MDATIVGLIVFACTFAGVLLGMWLRKVLPEHMLDSESKETVRAGIGLIATMTALVLGLVTASAQSSFDVMDAGVKQSATQILALDRALARYGPESGKIREDFRRAVGARIVTIWPQTSSTLVNLDPTRAGAMPRAESVAGAIRELKPRDETQRALQARALDLAESMLEARWLAGAGAGTSIPVPFLAVLVSWFAITFASFGLFAPRNSLVVTVLFMCALSVGSAVFLVLEMAGPFDGLLRVSPEPLRYAYSHLNL